MPDNSGDLYLYEAIELRAEFDRHIKLLEGLIDNDTTRRRGFLRNDEDEEKQPANGFDPIDIERTLKSIQSKRVKLNQSIQTANFEQGIQFGGNEISLSEALEVRKNLLSDLDAISKRVADSAYKRIIHKEERDIAYEPRHAFQDCYEEFRKTARNLRRLIAIIHIANHASTVRFKDEP